MYIFPLLGMSSGYGIASFPGGSAVKNLSTMQEPWVGKIPWRRAWQPTPVFLPGESPWTEEPGGLQSIRSQSVGRDWSNLARMHTEYDKSSFRKLKCFPNWLYQFFTHTSRVWVFQLLHVLNTCPFFHLWFWPPINRWMCRDNSLWF